MTAPTPEGWREILDAAPEGIVVCEATSQGYPVVYANAAFVQMCGHPLEALLGADLRILQGAERDQDARRRLREALERGETCRVVMHNYRPDGSGFWNEMWLQPVRDAEGRIARWVSYHREAQERLRPPERSSVNLPAWMREDRLTALHSRDYFEELLHRDWHIVQRDAQEISLTLFDIDDLGAYNETFDKAAGDACIRRVARAISSSYRRSSDLVGRWGGGTFAVLTRGEAAAGACEYAKVVVQRVRDLLIHHPRSDNGCRYVTLSAGVASLVPARDLPLGALVGAGVTALKRAKGLGKNNICAAEARDFKGEELA
ncbi:MAG TPA: diguanylate cyclase [Steroidobacteraceae bacterium]|nr:diguanylate cyclase [Steroidobacteraceae bacterium]